MKQTGKAKAKTSAYDEACQYLQTSWKTGHSLRSLVYEKERLLCSKRTFAIVSNVLQHDALLKDLLKDLMDSVDNKALLVILAYELLLSKQKRITGGGAIKRLLLSHHDELKARLEKSHPEIATKDSADSPTESNKPYHFRLVVPLEEISQAEVSTILKNSKKDPLLPNVYKTTIPKAKIIPHSEFIIQSQASCLPAICMQQHHIEPKAVLLDACAAPGNKTLQLHEYFTDGTIIALDKDPARFETLKRRCTHCDRIQPKAQDFLTYQDDSVHAILLDPSCSGGHKDESSVKRIESLAQFQTKCLSHALSAFPQCSTVVYSTCSHTIEENEVVVAQALKQFGTWTLTMALPEWEMRGNSDGTNLTEEQAKSCLRHSDGFFVAVFQRNVNAKRLKKRMWKARQHEAKRKRLALKNGAPKQS